MLYACCIFVLYEIFLACVVFMLYAGCEKTKREKQKMMCFIFPHVERALVLLCCILRAWDVLWRYCVIFLRVEHALALLYYIFPHVERALALFCCIFRSWNALWRYSVVFSRVWINLCHYCVIFFACGTRSGVIVLYFPRVEHDLVFCVKFISCCNILTL